MSIFDKKENEEDEVQTDIQMEEDTDGVSSEDTGELTPGQIKAKRYRDSLEKVIKYVVDAKAPDEIIEAAKTLRPSYFGITGGGGGGFVKAEFTADQRRIAQVLGADSFDDIEVGSTFDEMDAFKTLHAGRREMHVIGINLIKFPGQKDKLWLSFDDKKGIYTVEAIGEDAPEGWTGYLPKVKEVDA